MKKNILPLILLTLCGLFLSCSTSTEPSEEDIASIPSSWNNGSRRGNFQFGCWSPGKIYCTFPYCSLDINSSFEVLNRWANETLSPSFISVRKDGQRVLYITTLHSDVSMGALWEDKGDGTGTELLDSSYFVSSARFVGNTDAIIYYSYGSYNVDKNPLPKNAGYYLKRPGITKDSFLFQHISEIGPREVINGFDLSSDGGVLYYPLIFKDKAPRIIKRNLLTAKQDTLPITFDLHNAQECLWIRLNAQEDKLIYSTYPSDALREEVSDNSELGVVDLSTSTRKVIHIPSPVSSSDFMILFPSWSPDDAHILFGCGPIRQGLVGLHSLFILKNISRFE